VTGLSRFSAYTGFTVSRPLLFFKLFDSVECQNEPTGVEISDGPRLLNFQKDSLNQM
jgi:hypothetical protein